jgi:hypothetical protein
LAQAELRHVAIPLKDDGIDRGRGAVIVDWGRGRVDRSELTGDEPLLSVGKKKSELKAKSLVLSLSRFVSFSSPFAPSPFQECSAPSAPPCAARVLAQLRAPPPLPRPDAASPPVSFWGKAFWSSRAMRTRAKIAMELLLLFCFSFFFKSSLSE